MTGRCRDRGRRYVMSACRPWEWNMRNIISTPYSTTNNITCCVIATLEQTQMFRSLHVGSSYPMHAPMTSTQLCRRSLRGMPINPAHDRYDSTKSTASEPSTDTLHSIHNFKETACGLHRNTSEKKRKRTQTEPFHRLVPPTTAVISHVGQSRRQ